jgi:hypothetical protein
VWKRQRADEAKKQTERVNKRKNQKDRLSNAAVTLFFPRPARNLPLCPKILVALELREKEPQKRGKPN